MLTHASKTTATNKPSSDKIFKRNLRLDLPFMFNTLCHMNDIRGCMAINRRNSKVRINRRQVKDNKLNVNGKQASCMCTIQRKLYHLNVRINITYNLTLSKTINIANKITRGATTTKITRLQL